MNIEEQLLDVDGSCRDINFPDTDYSKAIALLKLIVSFSDLESAFDKEGQELSIEGIERNLLSIRQDAIISCWKCKGIISHIQLFFSWIKRAEVFVELTFFPDDVDKINFSIHKFLNWLRPILLALDTDEYFVRYENVSWKYGDTSEYAGVIFSNLQYNING